MRCESLPRSGNHLHLGGMAGHAGKCPVTSEQRTVEHLGESKVGGVVRGHIVAQLPDARQKKLVCLAGKWQLG